MNWLIDECNASLVTTVDIAQWAFPRYIQKWMGKLAGRFSWSL